MASIAFRQVRGRGEVSDLKMMPYSKIDARIIFPPMSRLYNLFVHVPPKARATDHRR